MLEEEKQPEERSEAANGRRSLFSELSRLFGSVAELVTEQAKIAELRGSHAISPRKKTSLLVADAKRIVDEMSRFKEELISDFGAQSYAFISKSIDPLIQQATATIALFEEPHLSQASLLQQAIQSVGLYTQFSDEKKLKRKIITEGIHALRLAIEKDCQLLQHYLHHALEEITDEESREQFSQIIQEKLEPIFHEFQELAVAKMAMEDLRSFFIWKSEVDQRRNTLTELGLITIDTVLTKGVRPEKVRPETEQEELESQEWHTLSSIEKDIVLTSQELALLSSLEERALSLFQILEDITTFNPETFVEVERIISDLKVEAKDTYKTLREHEQIKSAFTNLQNTIAKTEELLQQKQERKPTDTGEEGEAFS